MVNEAIQNGANLECGGTKHDAGSLFYKPTILTNVNKDSEIFKEEIFGPVLAIARFDTEEEGDAFEENNKKELKKLLPSGCFLNFTCNYDWD